MLNLRQLLNVAYAAIVAHKTEKERQQFDRELLAGDPSTVSHGTGALMSLMGVRPSAPPRPAGEGA